MLRDINARLVIGECDIAAVLLVLTVTGVFMKVDQAVGPCDVDDAVVPALVLGSGSLVARDCSENEEIKPKFCLEVS